MGQARAQVNDMCGLRRPGPFGMVGQWVRYLPDVLSNGWNGRSKPTSDACHAFRCFQITGAHVCLVERETASFQELEHECMYYP